MQKICIVGGSGSGKSTLARELGRLTGLPVVHLDQYYWSDGWQAAALDAEWRATHRGLIQGDRWIVDGCYTSTLAERMFRVLKRVATTYGRVRPDLAAGCPERLDWAFLRYVWRFRDVHRPRVMRTLEQWQGQRRIVTLQSPRQIRDWLTIVGQPAPQPREHWHATGERLEA
jgi:adenylate kinase family enzyme